MSITSLTFLLFVMGTLIVYFIVPGRLQWMVLLCASLIFYASYSPMGLPVMIATVLAAWLCALRIQRIRDEQAAWLAENKKTVDRETRKQVTARYAKRQGRYVLLCCVVTLGLLFLLKYYRGFAVSINALTGLHLWTAENLLLPLGLSYYSLQLIGYVTDVSRGVVEAERNPLKVLLYGGFFLSILQGPFNRYDKLAPQLFPAEKRRPDWSAMPGALLRILGGVIKKMVIADRVGMVVYEVFSSGNMHGGLAYIFGLVCFALQLYADFSGYMDIVCGVGGLFGITLPENFRQPFFAQSISEFWNRWHMSLGQWLKDYVFYPILKSSAWRTMGKWMTARFGKNAGRSIPTYLGMLVLWTLIGFWHGAGFHYVFSVGLLQFAYIFLGEITKPLCTKIKAALHLRDENRLWQVFRCLRTTALMMLAWVFFKLPAIRDGLLTLRTMAGIRSWDPMQVLMIFQHGGQLQSQSPVVWVVFTALCIIAMLWCDALREKGQGLRERILKAHPAAQAVIWAVLIAAVVLLGVYGPASSAANFIYFDF
ncbi:MAG: MBOAT family O-acyltransferase [Clostridia bacterium]|nr:MBOAT family O-acyltransferase [Clostridia bacterium]